MLRRVKSFDTANPCPSHHFIPEYEDLRAAKLSGNVDFDLALSLVGQPRQGQEPINRTGRDTFDWLT